MQEFNLDKIWEEANVQAKEHFQTIEGQIIEMAIRKSQNVLQKVVTIATWEMAIGFVFMAIVCTFFWPKPVIFWTALTCFCVLFAIALRHLIRLKSGIKQVHTYNTQKAIKEYIKILEAHQNRINQYLLYATPLTFLAGLLSGLAAQNFELGQFSLNWLFIKWLVFSFVGMAVLILGLRKAYLPWSVGKYVEELKGLID